MKPVEFKYSQLLSIGITFGLNIAFKPRSERKSWHRRSHFLYLFDMGPIYVVILLIPTINDIQAVILQKGTRSGSGLDFDSRPQRIIADM